MKLEPFKKYNDEILVPYVMQFGKLVDVKRNNEKIFRERRLQAPTPQDGQMYY